MTNTARRVENRNQPGQNTMETVANHRSRLVPTFRAACASEKKQSEARDGGEGVEENLEAALWDDLDDLPADEDVTLHLDLGEIPGFKYHTGVVFSAFSKEAGYSLSKGGRYDGLTKEGARSRPAVGFDLDLLAVTEISSLTNKHD